MKDNLSPNLTQKKEGEANNIDIKNSNASKGNLIFNSEEIKFSINIDSEMTGKKDEKYINKRSRPKKKEKTLPQKSEKDRQDNKITKIKTYILNSIFNYINKLLKEKNETLFLCKLDPTTYSENINRNDNLKLFNMTLKEIFLTAKISTKYTKENKEHNIKVINKIYKDPKLKQVLDITFRELLQIFIKNVDSESDFYRKKKFEILYTDDCDLVKFLTELRNKFENDKLKPKSEQYIKEYIDGSNEETSIMDLCMHMEEWFIEKEPRQKQKK